MNLKRLIAPLSNWKTIALVVAGGLIVGIVSGFIPGIHPIISKIAVSLGLGLVNPLLAVGGIVGVVYDFLGALPKPGKTEGTTETEAI